MSIHDSETVENVRPALAAAKYFVRSAEALSYEFGAASHIGLRRQDNQDHYLVLRRTRTQQLLLTNAPTEELALLCEEMGISTGLNIEALIEAGRLAERIVGHRLPSAALRSGTLAAFRRRAA